MVTSGIGREHLSSAYGTLLVLKCGLNFTPNSLALRSISAAFSLTLLISTIREGVGIWYSDMPDVDLLLIVISNSNKSNKTIITDLQTVAYNFLNTQTC